MNGWVQPHVRTPAARTRWLGLDDAIAACVRGELADLKTELGLRRLRDHLDR
jgi:hypothetical protein